MHTANRLLITTRGAAQTRALGRRLARLLRAGDVVLLRGDLGAGKTTLVQGVGSGLRVEGPVTSPTFVLLTRHDLPDGERPADTPAALYHADLYRLTSSEEVAELELDAQAADGVLLVEWPERGLEALPEEHLLVVLEHVPGAENERRLTLVAVGDRYHRVLDGLGGRG
jgi:tRNA threonylcarbamoyladenosine biosynthesis protein TsaE